MSANNRAKLIGKLQTALKKHYTPVSAGSRPLLEHILYASLLQDSTYELADEGIAKCEQDFYDWNEVRVTTVTELSQVLSNLPDPVKAAARLKGNLTEIFEEFFTFDIDHLKKENLGKAVAKFEKMSQMTPFVLSYAVQNGLGGHSIPIDYAALVVMLSTGIVSRSEAAEGRVPGIERAVPKTKGADFGSMLHQCGVALLMDPEDKTARAVLNAVDKKSSERMDEWLKEKEAAKKRVKRRKTSERAAAKKAAAAEADQPPVPPTKTKGKAAPKSKTAAKTPASATSKSAPTKPKSAPAKPKSAAKSEDASDAAGGAKSTSTSKAKTPKKPVTAKKASKPAESKKTAAKKPKAAAKSTTDDAPSAKSSAAKTPAKKATKRKADNRKLTKKKPR